MTHKTITYAFAGIVLSIVGILVVPLPPFVLDALLACNIIGSGIVLLLAITVGEPLEFAAFAPALLIATLFRLSLDVSATRLILTQGHVEGGVGEIIPAFGTLVVHGSLVVGLIVFAILVTIQFIVIASGSQRVAEVAARFTLDAMPGKQMAIDAEVHAGVLDAEGARRKRAYVQKEADFYGAMDGAGKFVKGDAIAALVIVVLNLIGGVVVGVAYHEMNPLDALTEAWTARVRVPRTRAALGRGVQVRRPLRRYPDRHCLADFRTPGRAPRCRRVRARARARSSVAARAVRGDRGAAVLLRAARTQTATRASRSAPVRAGCGAPRSHPASGDGARFGWGRCALDRRRARSRGTSAAPACRRAARPDR